MKKLLPTILVTVLLIGGIFLWYSLSKMDVRSETEHFKFYSVFKDKKVIGDLADALESNYNDITNNLMINLDEKINVKVYKNMEEYKRGAAVSTWTDTWVSFSTGQLGDIRMLSPQDKEFEWYNMDFARNSIVHQFVHVLMLENYKDMNDMPMWLTEGIATYESQKNNVEYKNKVKEYIQRNEDFDFKVLSVSHKKKELKSVYYDNFPKIGGYYYSYSIIDFIVTEYGYDKLKEICEDYTNYLNILEMTDENQFIEKWTDFLVTNY